MDSISLYLTALVSLPLGSPPAPLELPDPTVPAAGGATARAAEVVLPELVWAEFDGDGATDLLMLRGGAVRLLRTGLGAGLAECTLEYGLSDLEPIAVAAFVDFDVDGRADLFLVTASGEGRLLRNESGAAFVDATQVSGITSKGPILKAEWSDVNADNLPDVTLWTPTEVHVHRNLGGTFDVQRVTLEAPLVGGTGAVFAMPSVSAKQGGDVSSNAQRLEPAGARAEGERRTGESGGSTREGSPGGRTPGDRTPGAGSPLALTGPGYTTTAEQLPAPTLAMQTPANCSKFLLDAATQMCLAASSAPTLGALYPLSVDFNLDPVNHRVGVGTTTPAGRMHIVAQGPEAALHAQGAVAGYFDGRLEVASTASGSSAPGVLLETSSDAAGLLRVKAANGQTTMRVLAQEAPGNGPQLDFYTYNGVGTATLDAEQGSEGAALHLRTAEGITTLILDGQAQDRGGWSTWHTSDGTATVEITGEETAGEGGRILVENENSATTIELDGQSDSGGGYVALSMSNSAKTVVFDAEAFPGNGANMGLYNSLGVRTMFVDAEAGKGRGSQLSLSHANAVPTLVLDADTSGRGGSFYGRAADGTVTFEIEAEEAAGDGAQIILRKSDGTPSIVLDAEQGGDGRITTDVLEITGGADLVECFETSGAACTPGSVVVIDPARAGALLLSSQAYDTRVAGVVSGAGDVRPGLQLGQKGVLDGDTRVALSGRVYVRCSNENGAITPGDLLTSSATPGLAMRATEAERAFGAVIGKAMGALTEETGLVLVLVNLQ